MKQYAKKSAPDPQPDAERLDVLTSMMESGIAAVKAETCLSSVLPGIDTGNADRVLILGAGKAAGAMAVRAERHFRSRGLDVTGAVVVPYRHRPAVTPAGVEISEASHPHPDAAGIQAARRQMQLAAASGENDLVVFLASGGGSSLLPAPVKGVTLDDKRAAIAALMDGGMPIAQINCVRKHLSAVKGGRLATAARPSRVVSLVISDIPGDSVADVASGPMLPDVSTLEQARAAVSACERVVPRSVVQALMRPENETPKAEDLGNVEQRLVALRRRRTRRRRRNGTRSGLDAGHAR